MKVLEEGSGRRCSHWHGDASLDSQPYGWHHWLPDEAGPGVGGQAVLWLIPDMRPVIFVPQVHAALIPS